MPQLFQNRAHAQAICAGNDSTSARDDGANDFDMPRDKPTGNTHATMVDQDRRDG
jgi:hypothetical protein